VVPHRAFLEHAYWRAAAVLVDAGNHTR
jgi:hypothetical protein